MKINVYKGQKIVKTYETQEYKLLFGTVDDLIDAIDMEALSTAKGTDLVGVVAQFARDSRNTAKELIMDMFPEITEDELRHVAVDEIVACLVDAIKYVFAQVNKVGK